MNEKASPAQVEVLQRALTDGWNHDKAVGLLMTRGVSITTLDIMKRRGWVVQDYAIRDAAQRKLCEATRDKFIRDATADLEDGDWRLAHSMLSRAKAQQYLLDETGYWIQDAGRAAVGEEVKEAQNA